MGTEKVKEYFKRWLQERNQVWGKLDKLLADRNKPPELPVKDEHNV